MNKNKKSNLIFMFLVCIIISTIFTFNLSNSRYIEEIKAEEKVLAIPILTLDNNKATYLIENMIPGDMREYLFQVSNVDGSQTNEILLTYYFKTNIESDTPISIELYEILENGVEEKKSIINNVSEEFQMSIVNQESDKILRNYKLKVIWDESQDSYEFAGQEINFDIILVAEQVI